MFPLFICLISAPATEVEDIQKVLEFQYQEKLADTLKENQALKTEVRRLQASLGTACDSKTEEFKIDNKIRPTNSKADQQKLYRLGLQQIQDEQWDESILTMEGFAQQYPDSELAERAIYWIAQVYLQRNEVGLARAELERLIQLYPRGERAKVALSRLLSLSEKTDEKGKLK